MPSNLPHAQFWLILNTRSVDTEINPMNPNVSHNHIVIAEDDEHVALLLRALLQHAGYSVTCIADGRAMVALINQAQPPTLLILDLMLPYYDGLQIARTARQSAHWGEVPILALTALKPEHDMKDIRQLGLNDCLGLPFQPDELLNHVKNLIPPNS
jgi:DNA-binding response OmpR family regulator